MSNLAIVFILIVEYALLGDSLHKNYVLHAHEAASNACPQEYCSRLSQVLRRRTRTIDL